MPEREPNITFDDHHDDGDGDDNAVPNKQECWVREAI